MLPRNLPYSEETLVALRLRSKRNQHLYILNLFQTEEKTAVDHFIYEPNVHTVFPSGVYT